jgi:chaperonin GroEL
VYLVARALEQPLRRFVENGGLQGSAVVTEVCERLNGFGFNAISGEYEDLASSGVVDATKVVRVALQSAALVACSMLTTEPLMAMPAQASSRETSAEP